MRDAFSTAELEHQQDIVWARKYHDGEQGVKLTPRLEQFINTNFEFRLNICKTVVVAVSEKLRVTGFNSGNTSLIEWAQAIWRHNKMGARQEDIYENSLRDGESFIIVEWDNDEAIPIFSTNERYTDTSVDGNGSGVWAVYNQDDPNQDMLYAVKQWIEKVDDTENYIIRRNFYYPDRIEKWYTDGYTEWKHYSEEGEGWPIPWTGSDGQPLGIAVIPFNNRGLRCEAWDAFPPQDALNKTFVDLLSSSDLTAFRIYYALGFIPTSDGKAPADDGSNLLRVEPGTVISTTKSKRDAEFSAVDPADVAPLMNLAHQIVLWCAMVTNTPVSRFISTRLVASNETLKEQEGPLIARVTARQESFGSAWTDCFTLALKLTEKFGDGTYNVSAGGTVDPLWAEATSRGESEKLNDLKVKKDLGVPQEQLWVEMGYDTQTIEKMKAMKEEARDEQQRIFGTGQSGTESGGDESGNGDEPDTGTSSGGSSQSEDTSE